MKVRKITSKGVVSNCLHTIELVNGDILTTRDFKEYEVFRKEAK